MTDTGSMRWFGESWGAPVCQIRNKMAVPVDHLCYECGLPIKEDHRGFAIPFFGGGPVSHAYYHFECLMKTVLGPNWRDVVEKGKEEQGKEPSTKGITP
jgi:hypothetical protein